MKGCLIGSVVLLICVLFIAGGILGWDRTDVQVTGKAFTPAQVQIKTGDSVYFKNQTGHKGIVLCLGKQGVCDFHAAGPSALQKGEVTLDVDEMLPIEFSDAGTYTVTSPQHASMTLLVTVEKRSDSGGYGGGGGYSGGGDDGGDGGGSSGGGGSGGGGE
jgi:plastocyanin